MNTKDQWIQKTMESLDNIQQAEHNPFLAEKIMGRMNRGEAPESLLSAKTIWRLSLAFVMLLMLNVASVNKYRSERSQNHHGISSANEYTFEFNYNY